MQPAPKYYQQYFYQLQTQTLNPPPVPRMPPDTMDGLADMHVELPSKVNEAPKYFFYRLLVMQVWGVD